MEEFIADEVESILYIAREISGMPYALPYDAPMRERSSIQDPTFEGERGSPCARVGRPFSTFMEGSYACCGEVGRRIPLIRRCTKWYGPVHCLGLADRLTDEPF